MGARFLLALPGIISSLAGACGLIVALRVDESRRRRSLASGFAMTGVWGLLLIGYVNAMTLQQGAIASLLLFCFSSSVLTLWFIMTVPFWLAFSSERRWLWFLIPALPNLACVVLSLIPSTRWLVLETIGFEHLLGLGWVPLVATGPVGAACLGYSVLLLGFAVIWALIHVLRLPSALASRALWMLLATWVFVLVLGIVAFRLDVVQSLWGSVVIGIVGNSVGTICHSYISVWATTPVSRKAFLDGMRDVALISDERWQVMAANRAADELFGTQGSVLDRLVQFPSIRAIAIKRTAAAKEVVLEQNGESLYWHVRLQPVRHKNLCVRGWMLLISDRTAARRASDTLLASVAELDGLVSETRDGVAFFEPSGEIVHWNASLTRLTGIPPSRALNQNITVVHPELAQAAGFGEEPSMTKEPGTVGDHSRIYVRSLRLGFEHDYECRSSVFPIRVSDDHVLIGLMCRDLSAIRVAEREREETISELEAKLAEVRALGGLLPVCGWCGKVRSDTGYWEKLDRYLSSHAGAHVSHGICPSCARQLQLDAEDGVDGSESD